MIQIQVFLGVILLAGIVFILCVLGGWKMDEEYWVVTKNFTADTEE